MQLLSRESTLDRRQLTLNIVAANENSANREKYIAVQPVKLWLLANRRDLESCRSDPKKRGCRTGRCDRRLRGWLYSFRSRRHLLRWGGGEDFWAGAEAGFGHAQRCAHRHQMRDPEAWGADTGRAGAVRFLGRTYPAIM